MRALCTGYGPEVLWRDIMRAAVLVRDGLPWVASNTDMSIPTDFGIAPGHGVLVDMLSRFSGVTPASGREARATALEETIRRVGGSRPLMVGDRLDTDIEGAHNVGVDSLLVLTGVSGLHDLASALPNRNDRTTSRLASKVFVPRIRRPLWSPYPVRGSALNSVAGWDQWTTANSSSVGKVRSMIGGGSPRSRLGPTTTPSGSAHLSDRARATGPSFDPGIAVASGP